MGRHYVCARRRGARVFHSNSVLVATPGPSLFMNLEEEGNLGSCQDVNGAARWEIIGGINTVVIMKKNAVHWYK